MLKIIVAISKNNVIGKNNTIPWRCPEDLAHFKKLTMGKTILMGRKTFESLPGKLSGRDIIVLTRDKLYSADGIEVVHSIEEALEKMPHNSFIAGGTEIYNMFLPYVEGMIISRIPVMVEDGDAFFPEYEEFDWSMLKVEKMNTFSIETLERKGKVINE